MGETVSRAPAKNWVGRDGNKVPEKGKTARLRGGKKKDKDVCQGQSQHFTLTWTSPICEQSFVEKLKFFFDGRVQLWI